MSSNPSSLMSRSEVFAELARRGAERAVVEFSGGNDEGGADAITLYMAAAAPHALPTWFEGEQSAESRRDERLADALSGPVYEEYGTFAGDFDVSGEVIWDLAEWTVQMVRDERADYEHSERYL